MSNLPAQVSSPSVPSVTPSPASTHLKPVVPNSTSEASAERAAIIIALLGPDIATPLIKQIRDHHIHRFLDTYNNIRFIPRQKKLHAIAEFITQLKSYKGGLKGGNEAIMSVAKALLNGNKLNQDEDGQQTDGQGDGPSTWEKLKQRKASDLAAYLQNLRPEQSAIILSRLESDQAAEILSEADEAMAAEIISSLTPPPTIGALQLRAIEDAITRDFLTEAKGAPTEDDTAYDAVIAIISVLSTDKRNRFLELLAEKAPEATQKIKQKLLTFENLPLRAPPKAIPIIFREMDPAILVQALKYGAVAFSETVEYLYSNISKRMAEQFREQADELAELSQSEGEKALIAIISKVTALDNSGQIELQPLSIAEEASEKDNTED